MQKSSIRIKFIFYGLVAFGLLIMAIYGWKVLAGIAAIFLTFFGSKKPIQKVREKVNAKMQKLDTTSDPRAAHANNINDQLTRRRRRVNKR